MQQQISVMKKGTNWRVEGLIGLSKKELDSVCEQILVDTQLCGNTRITLRTRQGFETYCPTDLSCDSVRALILNKL